VSSAANLAAVRARGDRTLYVERLWPAVAPSIGILAVWIAASLLGMATWLPWPVTLLATASCFAAALALGFSRVRRLAHPTQAEIDRRIEIASRLPHRPLATLADRPALPVGAATLDPDTYLFWVTHQARAEASLARLRVGPPRLSLGGADRYALRFVLPVLVLGGLLVARGDAGALLLAAAAPGLVSAPGPAGTLQAWITPPRFTGLAPVFLRAGDAQAISVPAGSVLTASLTGSTAVPRLVEPFAPRKAPRFHAIADGSWQVEETLTVSGPVRVRQGGHPIANWNVTVEAVAAPSIAWDGTPGAWHGGWRTRLPWKASNQYGLASLRALLVPVKPAGAPPITLRLPLNGAPRTAHGVELPDLSASPFAGTAVQATLYATDATGQTGHSATVRFTLPARPFHNPLARAVLDARRRLALAPDDHKAAADDLATLGDVPGAFDRQPGEYLNLEAVSALLRVRGDVRAVDESEARLWELALVIEDGARHGTADARSALALRSARDRVDQQLERMRSLGSKGNSPAEQNELRRRIEALKQALAARMRELTRQALKNGTMLPPDAAAQALGGDMLGKMLKNLDDAAKNGRMDDAARQLSQMEDMLDRMRPATADDVKRALQQMQGAQQAASQMQALPDIIKRQSALLDGADKRSQAGAAPPDQPPAPAPDKDRRVQRALSRATAALSDQFAALTGKKPDALGKASDAMDRASKALAKGDDGAAAAAQREALADLQQGGKQMASAMRSGGGKGEGTAAFAPGFSAGDGGEQGDDQGQDSEADEKGGRDPLGRPLASSGNETDDSARVDLPDARARSRALEEELRRRDSDRERPRQELDYLDRLLKAF
jgi:uncharacterized protein (TIGR02302 family)